MNNHQIQEAGVGKYLVILAPFAAGAGVVAYAKYVHKIDQIGYFSCQFAHAQRDDDMTFIFIFRANPEFRKKLVNTVPGSEPLLKIFLQEEGNVVGQATKSISNATQTVIGVKDSIVGYFGDEKPSKAAEKSPTIATPTKSMENRFCFLSAR